PGVKAVGAALPPPIISGSFQNEVTLEDSPVATPQDKIRTDYARVTVDYFKAMEIPLVKGRYFTEQDTSDSVLVTIIDETMASEYFPGVDPIGRRIRMQNRAWQIVGVVGHVKNYGVNAPSRVEAFFSHEQLPAQMMTLALKTEGDPTAIVAAARNAVHEIDPNLPVYNIRTMNEAVAGTVSNERAVLILLGVFAAVALLLAVLGIYGVISSSVSQRTNEIGVRMALGATRADVLNLVLKQGLILTLIGVGVGIAAALALTRFLSSMLYGVGATDAMTFIAAPVVMAAIALAAIYVPARRATKVDPMIALRYE
ncbi:MAG TPA: FtsX-like permease family protein, partial [Blastocatellia bacterium]